MQLWEIFLLALAVSMDACAVAMTNGMCDAKMSWKRALLIGLFFGVFQMMMPIIGYYVSGVIVDNFKELFKSIAAWVSFGLLAFLGGKMVIETVVEMVKAKRENGQTDGACACPVEKGKQKPWILVLLYQAFATSVDALAVGVELQADAISRGICVGIWGATGIIGAFTCALSIGAVFIGKKAGNKLADKAVLLGGIVLLGLGLKILISSFF